MKVIQHKSLEAIKETAIKASKTLTSSASITSNAISFNFIVKTLEGQTEFHVYYKHFN